ncbi:MAG: helicase associated domain-containing protein, partial [Proteobacteria bacterium]|nr:helicase associated domain-containing protein [Pseudomonadota bacterium]
RILHRKGKLSPGKIERLEKIGFKWGEKIEELFEKGFQETLLYKQSTGNPNAPRGYKTDEGFRLGIWQKIQRGNYKRGKLSPDRIKRLEEIGFTWREKIEELFEKGFQGTLFYKESTGNPNVPNKYKTAEGFGLGSWQNNQRSSYRKGKLSPDRIKRLEDIGFTWEKDVLFEKGFQETLLYKESTGNPNVQATYKTSKGFLLGSWQTYQRTKYRKGDLSPERIARLEKIGFKWNMQEEKFGKGFQETLLYKENTGIPNAPKIYKTAEGYGLGAWQNNQKKKYWNGELSPDRIKRLEEIGFTWEKQEKQFVEQFDWFKKGFQETLLYKENTGIPNVPKIYKTAEGYGLGVWQNNQKKKYWNGKLSPDRIKRLEEIGFKWEIEA